MIGEELRKDLLSRRRTGKIRFSNQVVPGLPTQLPGQLSPQGVYPGSAAILAASCGRDARAPGVRGILGARLLPSRTATLAFGSSITPAALRMDGTPESSLIEVSPLAIW